MENRLKFIQKEENRIIQKKNNICLSTYNKYVTLITIHFNKKREREDNRFFINLHFF